MVISGMPDPTECKVGATMAIVKGSKGSCWSFWKEITLSKKKELRSFE